ncbi:helix-turn-helix domain-containing protein [Tyzzerella sp. OttesenSCG-928-J15]|nr:helix-turn-helix domain-containing protein [Tyzzerella sp. OttesenSCG-928-J15]
MSIFSQRLKELRKARNVKQTDVAEYLGVQPRTIRFYESGTNEPSFELVVKLADFYDVSTDYLLGRTDDETPPKAKS